MHPLNDKITTDPNATGTVPETVLPILRPTSETLNEEASRFLLGAIAFETENGWQTPDPELVNSSFPTKVLNARCQHFNLAPSGALMVLLVILSNGNPGRLVMWTWTLAHLAHRLQRHRITVLDWVNAYPMGVPSEDEYNRVWDAQKVEIEGHTVNGLDHQRYWAPLLPLPLA